MPRAGAGGGGSNRSSSGHGSSRFTSGHRPSAPGSGNRARGGASGGMGNQPSGFGGSSGNPMGGFGFPFPFIFGGSHRRGPYSNLPPYNAPTQYPQQGRYNGQYGGQYSGQYNGAPYQQYNSQNANMAGPFGPAGSNNGSGMPPMANVPNYNNQPNRQPNRFTGALPIIGILVAILVFVLILMMPSCSSDHSVAPQSTYNRERIDSGLAFNADCIDDQLGWFNNTASAGKRLKTFYDKTGIQPYIVFAKYNPKLQTDAQKQQWAQQWYDDHIDNEYTMLFVYFAEQNTDNDVGYMTVVDGKRIASVMDSQALDIFWSYIDHYWYSDASTDDAVVSAFDATADRIMTRTTTQHDVMRWIIIGIIIIAVLVLVIIAIRMILRRRREHEQYVERMVTTPLEQAADPVLEKYDQSDRSGRNEHDEHNDQQSQKGQ